MERLETLASPVGADEQILRGYVADDATHPDDQISFQIPSYDLSKQFGPSHFEPRPLQDGTLLLPSRGDPCLIALDEDGEASLLWWWAADPTDAVNRVTQAEFDAAEVRLAALETKPFVSVYRAAAFAAYATNTYTNIAFDTEIEDTTGMWVPGNPGRFTFQRAGVHLITAQQTWPSAANNGQLKVVQNGTTDIKLSTEIFGAFQTAISLSFQKRFAAGDFIEFQGRQASGGNLTPVASLQETWAQACWLRQ